MPESAGRQQRSVPRSGFAGYDARISWCQSTGSVRSRERGKVGGCGSALRHCRGLGQHKYSCHADHDEKTQGKSQNGAGSAFPATPDHTGAGGICPHAALRLTAATIGAGGICPHAASPSARPWSPSVATGAAPLNSTTPSPISGKGNVAADARGASPLADAVADSLHGMRDPRGPATGAETATSIHSPSSETTATAASPANLRTIPSTADLPSPRARALAQALAASSRRSWVIPAADPAKSRATRSRTAGSATANSAVTVP